MKIKSYRELKVWSLAMELVENIYSHTTSFPHEEKFGLSSQLRRAAVSVPSNIAEGHSKQSSKEYLRHISIAMGSLAELETQVELSKRLNYVNAESLNELISCMDEIGKMLRGIQKTMKAKLSKVNSSLQPLAPSP